jgi:hypothetical protein
MREHLASDPPAGRSSTRSPAIRTHPAGPGRSLAAVTTCASAIRARRTAMAVFQRALAGTSSVLLAIDAYVHFHDAGLYDTVTTATLSQGTLFRAQAVAAAIVAIALLIRPYPAVWAIAAVVAASAATAVLLYTYFDVGTLGPLPDMYEPTWALPGKRVSAAAEIAAALLAGTGLVLSLRTVRDPSVSPGDSPVLPSVLAEAPITSNDQSVPHRD